MLDFIIHRVAFLVDVLIYHCSHRKNLYEVKQNNLEVWILKLDDIKKA